MSDSHANDAAAMPISAEAEHGIGNWPAYPVIILLHEGAGISLRKSSHKLNQEARRHGERKTDRRKR